MKHKKELHLRSIKDFELNSLDHDKLYFSEINNWYSHTKKEGQPVKQYLSVNALHELLNSVSAGTPKDKAPVILKGLYKGGTAGAYAQGSNPFLFYDIDADPNKAWAYDKPSNVAVFDVLKRYSVLTWRSHSGNGIAGVIYCDAFSAFQNEDRVFHKELAVLTYKHLQKIIYSRTGCVVHFDEAQAKFRQVRYLAHQKNKADINLHPICFDVDFNIKEAKHENGLPKYFFSGDVVGSIQDQFNNDNKIEDVLSSYGYSFLSNGRVKSATTSATSSGFVKDNKLINFSGSSGKKTAYTPFNFVLEHKYFDDFKAFISDLKQQGYSNTQPKFENLSTRLKQAKTSEDIAEVCRNYKHLKYQDKIKTISTLEGEKKEAVITYLGLKNLELKPQINYDVKQYVSEVIEDIFKDLDDKHNIVLQAETGIGKTTAILREFERIRPNKRVLICVPLVSIAKQIASEYSNVIALTESSDLYDHYKARRNNVVVATYENAGNHLNNKNLFDYIVIDEAHNLFNANSYKSRTISKLALLIQDKKVLGLTATPNALFQMIGYTLAKVNCNKPKTKLIQRVYKKNLENVIINHINQSDRKLIIRTNSREKLKRVKDLLINKKGYSDDEILYLYSDVGVKQSEAFKQLTNKGVFADCVKIVLTTSVIDEGLSIKQKGFDTIFLENNYFLSPESVKQFASRFRNNDSDRSNYYYILKKADQTIRSITLKDSFNIFRLDDIDEFSKFKSLINQNIQYLDNHKQSLWFRGNDAFRLFINRLNLKEYNYYLESNFNLEIELDDSYNQQEEIQVEVKKSVLQDKKYFNDLWINNKEDIFKILVEVDKCYNKDLAKNELYTEGIFDDLQTFNEYVIFNIKKYKKLDFFYYQLGKYFDDPNEVMIEKDKIVYSTKMQNEILYQETKALLRASKRQLNTTDAKHKELLENVIKSVSDAGEFTKDELIKIWNKKAKTKYNHTVFLRVLNDYLDVKYNQRVKKFKVSGKMMFSKQALGGVQKNAKIA